MDRADRVRGDLYAALSEEICKDAQISVVPGRDPINTRIGMAGTDFEPSGQI